MNTEYFDVVIVGAGLSGVGAAYHLQDRCPGKRYVILDRAKCFNCSLPERTIDVNNKKTKETKMSRLATSRALAATIATTMLVAGCATPATPTIQTGPDAEVTYDGLHPVDNSQAELAWARPDFDISAYTKILPVSSGFEYRVATNRGRTSAERNRGGPFVIDAATRERFETLVDEVFNEELANVQNWEFVTEPGRFC